MTSWRSGRILSRYFENLEVKMDIVEDEKKHEPRDVGSAETWDTSESFVPWLSVISVERKPMWGNFATFSRGIGRWSTQKWSRRMRQMQDRIPQIIDRGEMRKGTVTLEWQSSGSQLGRSAEGGPEDLTRTFQTAATSDWSNPTQKHASTETRSAWVPACPMQWRRRGSEWATGVYR